MSHRVITVQFSRDGRREEMPLDPATPYQVRINGGPPSTFHSPWGQAELEAHLETLRNQSDERPTARVLKEIGKALGAAIHKIEGMEGALVQKGDEQVVVYWQLDYPELARIPWELATTNQPPFHHLMDQGVTCIRMVPSYLQDAMVPWPTGYQDTLRLLFVWGENHADAVPHKQQLPVLQSLCDGYGVKLVACEITNVEQLTRLCSENADTPFHFVHILAHGAMHDGNWGLRLKDEIAKPEQIARALRAGGRSPSIVTVAACDSANEKDQSFGSIAYQLHVYGVPLVMASQFRLRKSAANQLAELIYASLLRGDDLRDMLKCGRRQLATQDNEAWANDVIFTRYRYDALEDLAVTARQQGALRHANVIRKKTANASAEDKARFIAALKKESASLKKLVAHQERRQAPPHTIAETYGLLGSLQRRIADLLGDPPDSEELRCARQWYLAGLRADANSHYCGINVVHLSLRLGERDTAEEYMPIVRFAATSQRERDHWASATAGEVEVYAGNERAACEMYRAFARDVANRYADPDKTRVELNASKVQLDSIVKIFANDAQALAAARAARSVLESALKRNA